MQNPSSSLHDPRITKVLRELRRTDNGTNVRWLLADLLSLAAVLGVAIAWSLCRQLYQAPWWVDVPIFLPAMILIGGIQHRLAGLAHEAAHYTLLRNRFANDLVADLCCLFPLFATIQQYRVTHLAHHQFTNDWERDPDLVDVGSAKGIHLFPMSRPRFIWRYYVRFFLPTVMLGYLWQIANQSALGNGRNPYFARAGKANQARSRGRMRWLNLAGAAYVAGLALGLAATYKRLGIEWTWAAALIALGGALIVTAILPEQKFFQSPLKHAYSAKRSAQLRITWITLFIAAFPTLREMTGIVWGPYFWLLWVVPLLTSFNYFMMLRDVYQHANADQGRLTNSRVFFTDRFTWWAIFVYGQDMHVPHHLFPTIPHYNLPRAHDEMVRWSHEYRQQVVVCEGTFRNASGRPTILDVLEQERAAEGPISLPETRRAAG